MPHFAQTIASWIYRHIVLPGAAQPYTVRDHHVIAEGVHHVTLTPTTGQKLQHQPGQFMFVQFDQPGIAKEWHPFTISSAPNDDQLTVSMKESGDWTATLGKLTIGSTAQVKGPYGKFSDQRLAQPAASYVFIAGGIGITPLRSMIRQLAADHSERPMVLLYNARSLANFAFKEEFDDLAKRQPNLTVVYITSQARSTMRFGQIDADCIREFVPNLTQPHYFICGPKPMMTAVRATLHSLGVPKAQIHFEEFSLV